MIPAAAAARLVATTLEHHGTHVSHAHATWRSTAMLDPGDPGVLRHCWYCPTCLCCLLCVLQEGQGRPHLFCDMRIVDDQGKQQPQDGKAVGHLQVRGTDLHAGHGCCLRPAGSAVRRPHLLNSVVLFEGRPWQQSRQGSVLACMCGRHLLRLCWQRT